MCRLVVPVGSTGMEASGGNTTSVYWWVSLALEGSMAPVTGLIGRQIEKLGFCVTPLQNCSPGVGVAMKVGVGGSG